MPPRLVNTASTGQSEVLATLRFLGQNENRKGITTKRLARKVAEGYGGDYQEFGDAQFLADTVTVVAALQTAGFVSGSTGAADGSDVVKLTAAGRVQARHQRPFPRRIRA